MTEQKYIHCPRCGYNGTCLEYHEGEGYCCQCCRWVLRRHKSKQWREIRPRIWKICLNEQVLEGEKP